MTTEINQIVISLIEDESENTHLDFKREQYPIEKGSPKKSEFLKVSYLADSLKTELQKLI